MSSEPVTLISLAELLKLPDPEWLIRDLVPLPGITLLYGESGSGKSFVALDWSLSVATGISWLDTYDIDNHGTVVYIACEGMSGLKKRAAAWLQQHETVQAPGDARISFSLRALDLYDADARDALMATLRQTYPPQMEYIPEINEFHDQAPGLKLVVIDTLARSYRGEDESAAAEMGEFIRNIEVFCHDHGAAVLLVHHTGKSGRDERGSTALRGACEACFRVEGKKADGQLVAVTVECDKQKDGPELTVTADVHTVTIPSWVMRRDSAGRKQQSAVLVLGDGDE